jgi:hypothetical protein
LKLTVKILIAQLLLVPTSAFANGIELTCQGVQTQSWGSSVMGKKDAFAIVELDLGALTACYIGTVDGRENPRKCADLKYDETRFYILVAHKVENGGSMDYYTDFEINRFTGNWSSSVEQKGLGSQTMRYDLNMMCSKIREFESKKKF